jgi:hypothetical protein
VTDNEDIQNAFMDYFTNIFTSSNPTNFTETIAGISNKVNPPMYDLLNQDFNASNVYQVVYQLKSNSAPGPDGLSATFFQSYWDIIGEDITQYILDILNNGGSPRFLNNSYICLYPKTNIHPSQLLLDLLLYVMSCLKQLPKA